jgi:hypothetical protein
MLSGVMVKFEDLCPEMSNQSRVPAIGNVMAARWAFEALAVNQFKNNRYEQQFFDLDEQVSNASYITDYWVPEMKKQVDATGQMLSGKGRSADALNRQSRFFTNEFRSVYTSYPGLTTYGIDGREVVVTSPDFVAVANRSIDSINKYCIRQNNAAFARKQEKIVEMNNRMGVAATLAFRNSYYNDQLEEMVLSRGPKDKIILADDHLVRKYEPLYINSTATGLFAAPFYAHAKSFMGMQLCTMAFNLIIIWLMAAMLYVVLYFDLLRKLLDR